MQESEYSNTTSRIANGDTEAFALFFRAQWPQVYGTALHLTRDPEQAADLAQDIFAKLWQHRERLRDVQHPENYLYIFSRNHVMDFLRKKVLHTENIEFLVDHFREPTASAQERMEYAELRTLMRQAIDSLPAKVKTVFLLSRTENITHEQIAQRLGISIVSSKTYIVRALRHIRAYLAKHGEGNLIALIIRLGNKLLPMLMQGRYHLEVEELEVLNGYRTSRDKQLREENLYTFDYIVPIQNQDSLAQFALGELNRYTDYHGRIEKRNMPSYVLVSVGGRNPLFSNGGEYTYSLHIGKEAPDTKQRLINGTWDSFLTWASSTVRKTDNKRVLVDETGFTENIDIEFQEMVDDYPSLRRELQRHGLDIIEAEREVDVFVLSDKKKN